MGGSGNSVNPGTSLSDSVKDLVIAGMKSIEAVTCLTFRERYATDQYGLDIFKGSGCWSYVGVVGSKQQLSYGNGCYSRGTIQHEILHALGFWHEQSRYDRNQHVEILWENINPQFANNFNRYSQENTDNLDSAYDFGGVMHYSKTAFTINGQDTIKVINDPDGTKTAQLGQRAEMSNLDIQQVNALYACSNDGNGDIYSGWSNWSPCFASCTRERQRFCFQPEISDCTNNRRSEKETQDCAASECIIDGHWGRWSSWSSCSAAPCQTGTQVRTRTCSEPAPANGGAACPTDVASDSETGACLNLTASCIPATDCFFEDTCDDWIYGDWTKQSGATQSSNTGPSADYTGTLYPALVGTYMYLEASGKSAGATVTMQTREYTDRYCMSFWFHMYGSTMGDLKVQVNGQNLFQETANRGDQWINQKVDVYNGGSPYRVSFVATRGSNWASDIAVDHIEMTAGTCNGDVDECTTGSHTCSSDATCTNTEGSFTCTCKTGYTGDGFTCSDINECASSNACPPGATWVNSDGSFTCTCPSGYQLTESDGCIDIDECLSGPCSAQATCSNTAGSFTCTCKIGYTGDGFSCQDIDECLSGPCSAQATCSNTAGSFTCTCKIGYTGNGSSCQDINECASSN